MSARQKTLQFAEIRGKLAGILTLPSEYIRGLCILIPGSGPTTREGIADTERVEGIATPFAAWAAQLCERRYASFRFDKRAAAFAEEYARGARTCNGIAEEYLEDLSDALDMLRQEQTEIFHLPVALIGHSLGALAALLFADARRDVAGVVGIGAPVEGLHATLLRQLVRVLPEADYQEIAMALKAAVAGNSHSPVLGMSASYWRNYEGLTLDHLLNQRRRHFPVLLLQGTEDQLVSGDQFQEMAARLAHLKEVNFQLVVNADHFLMTRRPEFPGDHGSYDLESVVNFLDKICREHD